MNRVHSQESHRQHWQWRLLVESVSLHASNERADGHRRWFPGALEGVLGEATHFLDSGDEFVPIELEAFCREEVLDALLVEALFVVVANVELNNYN